MFLIISCSPKPDSFILAIAGGDAHSLALKEDGILWVTEWNYYGQLGTGDNTNRDVWTKIDY